MRINVYSQELTTEVNLVEKYAENVDRTFSGAQLILHSSPRLHHTGEDDDRSAITFWLPKSAQRREELAMAFERVADLFRTARAETGSD